METKVWMWREESMAETDVGRGSGADALGDRSSVRGWAGGYT
jgi:hypothetical protein